MHLTLIEEQCQIAYSRDLEGKLGFFVGCTSGYDVSVTSSVILLASQAYLRAAALSAWQLNTPAEKYNNESWRHR